MTPPGVGFTAPKTSPLPEIHRARQRQSSPAAPSSSVALVPRRPLGGPSLPTQLLAGALVAVVEPRIVLVLNSIPDYARMHFGRWIVCLLALAASFLLFGSKASADECPPNADKPNAHAHVDYNGVQHLTYCYRPVAISPVHDIIRSD